MFLLRAVNYPELIMVSLLNHLNNNGVFHLKLTIASHLSEFQGNFFSSLKTNSQKMFLPPLMGSQWQPMLVTSSHISAKSMFLLCSDTARTVAKSYHQISVHRLQKTLFHPRDYIGKRLFLFFFICGLSQLRWAMEHRDAGERMSTTWQVHRPEDFQVSFTWESQSRYSGTLSVGLWKSVFKDCSPQRLD